VIATKKNKKSANTGRHCLNAARSEHILIQQSPTVFSSNGVLFRLIAAVQRREIGIGRRVVYFGVNGIGPKQIMYHEGCKVEEERRETSRVRFELRSEISVNKRT
jgi:hypothetical protein